MSPTAKHPIVAPFYAAAVTWLLYALLLPLYRPLHFACAIAAAAMVFLISYFICRSGAKKADANEAKAQSAEQKAAAQAGTPSGNPALDKVMKDGALAIEEMRRLDKNIEDEKISASAADL